MDNKKITLVFLKPDTFETKVVGKVIADFEAKFPIRAIKMMKLNKTQAEEFYAVHKGKPFYDSLTNYIARGPIVAMILEGDDSLIEEVRTFMGNTNPEKAEEGTIRQKYGQSLDANVVHGSDSFESATKEIPFFFSCYELLQLK
jgi:nucleoside-diphosphate kinase